MKTDAELERDLLEAIKPLMEKWDRDYIEGMRALGYTDEEAWRIVGRRGPGENNMPQLQMPFDNIS